MKAAAHPCEAAYLYRSVIIQGRASLVGDEDERAAALEKNLPLRASSRDRR